MRLGPPLRTVLALAYAGALALLLWSRTLSPWALAGTGVLVGLAGFFSLRRSRRGGWRPHPLPLPVPLSLACLGLALVVGTVTAVWLEQGERSWEAVRAARETRLSARLEDRMLGVVRRAEAAAGLAAGVAGSGAVRWAEDGELLFAEMERIRHRTGVDALALLDAVGRPVAWAGDHRGQLPRQVLEAESAVVYPGGTLFSYLYVVVTAANGQRAVSAVLVQAGPPVRGRTGAVGERFEAVTGEQPRFGPGAGSAADWVLVAEGVPVLHVRWPALSHSEWREDVSRTGRRAVFLLVMVVFGLLWASWLRLRGASGRPLVLVPVVALILAFRVAPLRRILGMERLFSPGFFVLPIPGDITVDGLLAVLLPLAALVSTLRPPRVRWSDLWLRLSTGGALAGGVFALGAGAMVASAGPPMLTAGGPLWYVLMPTTVVLLTALTVPLTARAPEPEPGRRPLLYGALAGVASFGLALALAGSWRPGGPPATPLLLAWSLPFVLGGRAVAGYHGRGDRLLRWLAVGWLASTAVIPHHWIASQSARLAAAEAEVESFGARTDPYLTWLLVRFGEELRVAAERGEQGGDLLYEAWVSSSLAAEPYPVELSFWDTELNRVAHLPLGLRLDPGSPAHGELLEILRATIVRDEPENIPATGGGVSRFLTVPLEPAGAVSVAVAPRATLRPASPLSYFMEGGLPEPVRLELLPAEGLVAHDEPGVWRRTEEGWRRELMLEEGPDLYHAHLELRTPPAAIRFARGVLLVTFALLILAGLWIAGRFARGDPPAPPGGWVAWFGGFRARLIVALFAFFLLPTAVFGWAAYRALADEVARAAGQVAERAVAHVGALLPEAGLAETARRTGEDLLYYRTGALAAASMPEAQELGLYSAWMPGRLFREIQRGEATGGTEMGELAGRAYMVAYRRLRSPDEAVGVPVWLAAREVAVRQQEFAHLVLFGTVLGAVLSLALSVLVGRALARPIGELRRAAAAVGRGHLRVRLHDERNDEFGDLFSSFNRMTRRLRQARARELRTARILAWGEMARQVAHEIKNPLTPIKLSVQHIRRAYQDGRSDFDAILDSNVEQILNEIDRLTEIARAFSRYGAPQEARGEPEPVDVAAVARDVLMLYRAPDRSVRYRLTAGPGGLLGAARALELREVLVNLLENARAAVGDAGLVEVSVEPAGRHVRLEVRDDGEGIAPEQLPRIFDPHFSTRSSGTGLGLAIVRRLVEGWGGEVRAESEPGQGTVVAVLIPNYEFRTGR
jgi:signal transduction histidine kinase